MLQKIKSKAKEHIKNIQFATKNAMVEYEKINNYNSYILGKHNYYKKATNASADFQARAFAIKISIRNRLKKRVKRKKTHKPKILLSIKEKYGKSKELL